MKPLPPPPASDAPPFPRPSLGAVALLFLRLGVTSFGGPAVHLALMEEECVRRRGWLSHEEFVDFLGAVNIIPGPNSTEMAIHIGYRTAGWKGLVLAGSCFILPAMLIVTAFAWAYTTYGALPPVAGILSGVKPVVIAVVAQALWNLARSCVKTWKLGLLGPAACVLAAAGVHELVVLFGAGLLVALLHWLKRPTKPHSRVHARSLLAWPLFGAGAGAAAASAGLWEVFWVFFRVGATLFGSGYVLLAYLQADLVERRGWLTEQQLLDAVAVGQVTPGPVFTTATFIGYLLGGPDVTGRLAGAAAATAGIFLPAFLFVALSIPLWPYLRRSALVRAFLDGVNVASLALMAVVTWQLAGAALVDAPTVLLGLASAVLLLRYRVNSTYLVLGGAAVGLIQSFLVIG